MPEPIPPEDTRAVRWIVGVPLVFLNVVAAAGLLGAFTFAPEGPWDDGAYAAIGAACACTVAASALALAVAAWPAHRRLLGPWWMLPPLGLGAAAVVRWASSTN